MIKSYFYSFLKHNKIKVSIFILSLSLYFGLLAISVTLTKSIPDIAAIPLKSIGIQTIVQKTGKIPDKMVGVIYPHSNGPITDTDLKKITSLRFVEGYDRGLYMWVFDASSFKAVFGVDAKYGIVSDILKKNINQGSFGITAKTVLVTDDYARKNKLVLGNSISITGVRYTVQGILKPNVSGNIIPADIYMDLNESMKLGRKSTEMQKLYKLGAEDFNNVILLRTNPAWEGDKDKAIKAIDKDLIIFSEKTFSGEIKDQLKIISSSGSAMFIVMGVILLFAFCLLIIFNLKTREKEIAILRMIGWKLSDLKRQFIGETFALLIVSLFLGNIFALVGLGIVSTQKISMELPWDISAKPHFLPQENNIERIVTASIPIHIDVTLFLLMNIAFIGFFLVINYVLFYRLKNIKLRD
jgi:ABC-type lipoprotein release transport system permease subunit